MSDAHGHHDHHHHHDRTGAKQPEIFSHERAAMLDDPAREAYAPTERIVELLDVPPGGRVLDFGAGTGRYALAIAKAHPDARVVAYDVQPEFLTMIRDRAHAAGLANIEAADAYQGTFERVLAINVLHEIGDADIAAIRNALAPGGTALVIDWDGGIERPVGPPNDHAHSIPEALDRLQAAGLRAEERHDDRFPYHFVLIAGR
ncbi:MAG: class I SAM-dependent methyltransferase [bacterium]|nr:class I SAM-dependent methyltransferase [bacterium]